MYDLNLSVPNLTSPKYSNDNKFLLLKNYLYELNETLSFALGDKSQTEIQNLKKEIEAGKGQEKQNIIRLKNDSKKRFEELKEQIIRTAEEIQMDYSTAISESEREILQTAQGQFATKTEFGEYKNQVDTELLQTAESITANAKQQKKFQQTLKITRRPIMLNLPFRQRKFFLRLKIYILPKQIWVIWRSGFLHRFPRPQRV